MNYGNRNASSTYTNTDLARGYFGAVIASIGISVLSRKALSPQLSRMNGTKLLFANAGLNYCCAAFAGATNLILMR